MLETARRRCDELLRAIRKEGKSETDGLGAALHVWLVGEVDLVEDFVQATPIVSLIITFGSIAHTVSDPIRTWPQSPLASRE